MAEWQGCSVAGMQKHHVTLIPLPPCNFAPLQLFTMKNRLKIPLLLAPALTVILLFFVGGLVLAVMQSLGYMPIIGRHEVSLAAYRAIFSREDFYRSLALTTWIGVVSTAVSTMLAIISALALRRAVRGRRVTTFIFQFNCNPSSLYPIHPIW